MNSATDTSRIYVANCTLQNQMFQYSLERGGKSIPVLIRMGQQVELPTPMTNGQVAHLENLHRVYGLRRVDEIKNLREYTGLVLSVGKPVPLGSLGDTIEFNREKLKERGAELRKEAAVAAANSMGGHNPHVPVDDKVKLDALEVEIREEEKPGRDTELNETVRVTNSLEEASQGGGRKRRGRRD